MSMDKKIERKKWSIQRISLYAFGLIAVGFIVYTLTQEASASRLNVQTERLLTDTVRQGVFKEYTTIFGVVEPVKTVYLDAIESGRVEAILVENGAMVEQGQEILRLSNLDLQLNVLNQEAQIINQINTIRNTSILMDRQSLNLKEQSLDVTYRIDLLEKQTNRNRQLYSDKVISEVEYEETEAEYKHLIRRGGLLAQTIEKDSLFQVMQQNQMDNSLDLMKRNLAIAKSSLDNLVIRAPISGQLSGLGLELGELINRGDRIAQIDVLEDFKIRARIDEHYISRIFPEQEGSFVMDDKTYHLKIRRVYPEVTEGHFQADLVFVGERPDNIKRGQSIPLKISLSDETEAMLLARGGFYKKTGGNWVYVINPNDGTATKKEIRIGRQNPLYYEVSEGLNPGDIVIISSYENYIEKDVLVLK